jgi:hypothetical protein
MQLSLLLSVLPALVAAVPAGSSSSSSKISGATKAASSSSSSSSSSASSSASVPPAMSSNGVTMGMKLVSDAQVANAVNSWQNNTGKVSNFLNTATSLVGDDFTRQATIALNAEKDELNHKMILDAAMGMQPDVQSANMVLAMQGTFQMVVDVLNKMATQGPDTARADVDAINQNRCVNV